MVDARRNTDITVKLIQPVAMDEGPSLRDPRGCRYRRRRSGYPRSSKVDLEVPPKRRSPSGGRRFRVCAGGASARPNLALVNCGQRQLCGCWKEVIPSR